MTDVPKIVRQRLGKPPETPHPDANLLSAFLERSLLPEERVGVLEHLAGCASCRETVALAAPEPETLQAIGPRWQTGWLSWQVLRWGAAAACVVVVSAAVLLHRDRFERQAMAPSFTPEAKPTAVDASVSQRSDEEKTRHVAVAEALKLVPGVHEPAPAAQPRARRRDESERGLPAEAPRPPYPATTDNAPAVPSPSAAVGEGRPAGQQAPDSAGIAGKLSPIEDAKVEFSNLDATSGAPRQAARPTEAAAGARTAYAQAPLEKAQLAAAPTPGSDWRNLSALPRWSLAPGGVLQRSLDAGKTWSPVEVPGSVTAFRVVASIGPSVWAGGGGGQLFHSPDAGIHWSQVVPVADGKPLTKDIVRIEFSTTREGRLTTSDGELWTTSDAGETWKSSRP